MATRRKYGVFGGGNMGEALVKGLLSSGRAASEDVAVSEPLDERRSYLEETYKVKVLKENTALAPGAAVLILAVKPQVVVHVLEEIRTLVEPEQLVVSIAAGVTTGAIESTLRAGVPVVRAMPNTPALVLAGATAVAGGRHASAAHLEAARALFESVGRVVEVEEKDMDAVTGLSGSGPAYFFVMLEALADAGVLLGLPRDKALMLASQTALGAARLVLESGLHPGRLKDMVTSPGGTTIAGLKVLEQGGIRGLLMAAVEAATQRSLELGRKSG